MLVPKELDATFPTTLKTIRVNFTISKIDAIYTMNADFRTNPFIRIT